MKFVFQDKEGKAIFGSEYRRNSDGTIKTYKGFDENGKVKYYYDNYKNINHGLFESCQFKILNGKDPEYLGENVEYEYDDNGNWIKKIGRGWIMIERKTMNNVKKEATTSFFFYHFFQWFFISAYITGEKPSHKMLIKNTA